MLPRLVTASRAALSAARGRVTLPTRQMSAGPGFKTDVQVCQDALTTVSHMPVPSGSWQAAHSARINKWNMILGSQVAIFLATCWGIYATNAMFSNPYPKVKQMDIDPTEINPLLKK